MKKAEIKKAIKELSKYFKNIKPKSETELFSWQWDLLNGYYIN